MRKLLTLTTLFLLVMVLNAKSLVLVLSDGTQVYYYLGGEKNPVMKYDQERITIESDNYTFENIVKFYVSNTDADGIDNVKATDFSYDGSTFYVNTTSRPVKVYKTDGTETKVGINSDNGVTAIQISSLERGVYIVKIGKSSFKFVKK